MRDHPHDISEHRGAHLHIPPPIDTKEQMCSAHWSPESRCNPLHRHWSESWGGGRGLSLIGRGHFCTSGRPIGGRSRLRYRWVWPDRPLSPHGQWRSFWPSQPLHLLKTQWDGRSLQLDTLLTRVSELKITLTSTRSNTSDGTRSNTSDCTRSNTDYWQY